MAADPGGDRRAFTRSSGVLVSPFGDGAVAVDLATDTAHLLGAAAGALLAHDGPTPIADLLAAAASEGAGAEAAAEAAAWLEGAVAQLRAAGLADRTDVYTAPAPPGGSSRQRPGRHVGAAHAVLADAIAFRSDDAGFVEAVDRFLGPGIVGGAATLTFDVAPTATGGVDLWTESLWAFPTVDGFLAQLPAVLNDYAARTHAFVALHSGAVRTPDGRVVLLSGPENSGKSTLTAALVAAGCDYLGDESIGIRTDLHAVAYPKPFTVDATSRAVLGLAPGASPHVAVGCVRADTRLVTGAVGPVAEVLVVRYDPAAVPAGIRRLDEYEALEALCANTLNLARSGEAGLATLCAMAAEVPVRELVHPGIDVAVPLVLADAR